MTDYRRFIGKLGENQAADYLQKSGYSIFARNVRTPYGEIDLIARQKTSEGDVTVFIEVKTRRTKDFGFPEESITRKKMEHMTAAAQFYITEHPELEGEWRIDVIAIHIRGAGSSPTIRHFENAAN